MVICLSTAFLFRREGDFFSALSFAGIICLLLQPSWVNSLGFHLSFVTVGGLGLIRWEVPTEFRSAGGIVGHYVRQLAAGSYVAWLFSTPLVAAHFGSISLISVVANVVLAIPASGIVILSIFAHAMDSLFPFFGAGVMLVFVLPLTQWVDWLGWFGNLPGAAIEVPRFSGYWLILIYAVLFWIGWSGDRRA